MKFRRSPKQSLTPGQVMWRKQALVAVLLTLLVAIIGTATHKVTRLPRYTITDITVVGGETISHEEVRGLVAEALIGSYYRLIPRQFTYLYPHDAIEERIAAIPRIKNVSLTRSDRTTIAVAFEEYRPFALWCEDIADTTCLFVDRTGYAFAEAPKLQGGAFLRYTTPATPQVDAAAFDAEFVRTTNAFVETVYEVLNLNIVHVEVDETDVTYHIAGGGMVHTTLRMGVAETLANLETIMTSAEFAHLAPGNFQYIDLRYGNKVFVNEELPEAAVASSSSEALAI